MQLQILGPLRVVTADGDDATPRARQQRQVLTLLAAAAPDPVASDTLEELLWSGLPPSSNALQTLVSKLRKVVAPARIDSDERGYRLEGASVDVAEFERSLDDDPAAAEAMVRGEPLVDVADHPVAAADVARVTALVRTARARRLTSTVDGARPDDARGELESLVVSEPLDERWWALLMRVHARCGRQAEALRAFRAARRVLVDELGLEPGPELVDLERRILDRDPSLLPPTASSEPGVPGGRRVPSRLASFVGRADELRSLADALERHRVVTIVGPGGGGKTATAQEYARRRAADSSRWVELASHTDRDGILRAIAAAIGAPEAERSGLGGPVHDDRFDRVVDILRPHELLLVVDNCEHVVGHAAELLHRLLAECPHIRVLATSREPLGVPGEHVFALPALPAADAVTLFVERATASARGDADVDRDDRIAELCRRLDGLPLAIELAVSRLRTMTVDELLTGLDDRFALLAQGARTAEPRQQTLRAVVDWSHELLEPIERIVLRRLSVFVGGATAEAATAVCAGDGPDGTVPAAAVPDVLGRLVDKSLIIAEPGADGMRFGMLETLREYAMERLATSGEDEAVVIRHARHVARSVAPARRGLIGHDQADWFRWIAAERPNIDAAFDAAVACDDGALALEIATPLGWYFFMSGEIATGTELLGAALACSGDSEPGIRGLALGLYGWLVANGPQIEQSIRITGDAVALLDAVDDPWSQAIILNTHVMAQFFAGRLDLVDVWLPRVIEMAERSDDPWVGAVTSLVQGEVLQFRGEPLAAERALLAAADDFERVGDRFAYALTITEASEIAEQFGDYETAVALLERGIALADEVGFSGHPLAMRGRLANVEILRGNLDRAERLHRSLLDDVVAAGVPWLQAMARWGLSTVARRRGDLDEARQQLDHAWENPRVRSVPYLRSIVLVARGYLADQLGEFDRALELQRDGLRAARQIGTPRGLAYSLEGCAGALSGAGTDRQELAVRLLGAADRLRRESGAPMPAPERFDLDRTEARLRGALGERFDTEFAAGAAADVDALSAAIDSLGT